MRYSTENLRTMAQTVLADKAQNGARSFQLVMQLCLITGLRAEDVLSRIERLKNAV